MICRPLPALILGASRPAAIPSSWHSNACLKFPSIRLCRLSVFLHVAVDGSAKRGKTDDQRPQYDDAQKIKTARRDHPYVPIVVMTGYADARTLVEPLPPRVVLLKKPFKVQQLAVDTTQLAAALENAIIEAFAATETGNVVSLPSRRWLVRSLSAPDGFGATPRPLARWSRRQLGGQGDRSTLNARRRHRHFVRHRRQSSPRPSRRS
jgi:hypothetical protein